MAQHDSVTRRGFVGGIAILLVAIAGTGGAAEGTHFVWFGTYTGKNTGSEGIYVSRFDAERGTLSAPELAVAANNPSFLAVHPKLPVLYAVAETSTTGDTPSGAVLAFAIDPSTGKLRPMNEQLSGGGGPCHLSVDRSGQVVVAANYGGGSSICLGLAADGSLKPVVTGTPGGFVQHVFDRAGDAGINPGRQEAPHAHSADIAPDGRFAFVCDLGLDQVIVYALDGAKATIAPHSTAHLKNGVGPRHFAMHPGGGFAYCVNEMDLSVTAFSFDPKTGSLTPLQTLSTLPEGVTDRKGFSCAEIAVHPTGRFVYASNRGHDTIAVFAVDEATGRLTFRGVEPIRGKTPRHFALSPDGRFLFAEGQASNTVAIFSVDPKTGMLGFTDRSITVPAPVSAVIRPID
ncbi:MAG: lactonase family protein [Planctomycetia bacterium]